MADNKKKQFRRVVTDSDEFEQKIKEHRYKIAKRVLLLLAGIVLVFGFFSLYFMFKTYTDYTVMEEIKRKDTMETKYLEFSGNILKYSNDGVLYTDVKNNLIWNQTYEMNNPLVDICENYVAVASGKGTHIYILNTEGLKGEIDTAMPILQIEVGNQGTVAVLMEQEGTNYVKVYDRDGKELAQGELHLENSGYPLSMTLSNDCKKMAISLVNLGEGAVDTVVNFYNFGSVGQNEIDNVVQKYTYKDTIIPEIEFLDNDFMVAFGDKKILVYEGKEKPVEREKITFGAEVKTVFHSASYFGFVYDAKSVDKEKANHVLEVYEKKGSRVLKKEFNMEYAKVEIINDEEIVITGDMECMIYNKKGILKFHGKTKSPIQKVQKGEGSRDYVLILQGKTQYVKLK